MLRFLLLQTAAYEAVTQTLQSINTQLAELSRGIGTGKYNRVLNSKLNPTQSSVTLRQYMLDTLGGVKGEPVLGYLNDLARAFADINHFLGKKPKEVKADLPPPKAPSSVSKTTPGMTPSRPRPAADTPAAPPQPKQSVACAFRGRLPAPDKDDGEEGMYSPPIYYYLGDQGSNTFNQPVNQDTQALFVMESFYRGNYEKEIQKLLELAKNLKKFALLDPTTETKAINIINALPTTVESLSLGINDLKTDTIQTLATTLGKLTNLKIFKLYFDPEKVNESALRTGLSEKLHGVKLVLDGQKKLY